MTGFAPPRAAEVHAFGKIIQESYDAFKERGLQLDLTRGKPSPAQLDLCAGLLELPGPGGFVAEGAVDCRNYGGLQGLQEARKLFVGMMGATPEQIVVANNSSLALMHDTVMFALLKGTCDSEAPWLQAGAQSNTARNGCATGGPVQDEPEANANNGAARQGGLAFLCPVPGYDRHFKICEDYGIRMIPVALREDGPDMDEVEGLVAEDASIKGMWCVPKYSNPTGTVYSGDVIERLAAMKTAARDFRLFWDNAYGVHHLTSERVEIANILELCAKHGHANRAFVFASTSKITLAGSGLALFAGSAENVKWLLARMGPQTIGPDKLNQLRHVHFLRDAAGIERLMERHRELIAPKFEKVQEIFGARLAGMREVSWSQPKGGYFITLQVPRGTARRVVNLAKEAGVALTPAGATHPFGNDPEDRVLRIAPTYVSLEEVAEAATGVALSVKLATGE